MIVERIAKGAYTGLWYFLLPFLLIGIFLCWPCLGRYRSGLSQRFGRVKLDAAPHRLWIHGASVGEVLAAKILIDAIHQQYPHVKILLTTITWTGAERVIGFNDERIMHCYFPIDIPFILHHFVKQIKPSGLILLETELWPNLINVCYKKNIDVVLVNGRLSHKAFGYYQKAIGLFRPAIKAMTTIGVQNQAIKKQFIALGAQPQQVIVTGNIKYDLQISEKIQAEARQIRLRWGMNRPVWIAASTRPGEEPIILKAHGELIKYVHDALLVIVPRHPQRFDAVASLIKNDNFPFVRFSETTSQPIDHHVSVVLGDSMGVLLTFYAAADVALVGGSLVDLGGHNPLEPAALTLPILSGPYTSNFSDVYQQLMEHNAVTIVNDSQDLSKAIERLLSNPSEANNMAKQANQVYRINQGAVLKTMALLPASFFRK